MPPELGSTSEGPDPCVGERDFGVTSPRQYPPETPLFPSGDTDPKAFTLSNTPSRRFAATDFSLRNSSSSWIAGFATVLLARCEGMDGRSAYMFGVGEG